MLKILPKAPSKSWTELGLEPRHSDFGACPGGYILGSSVPLAWERYTRDNSGGGNGLNI